MMMRQSTMILTVLLCSCVAHGAIQYEVIGVGGEGYGMNNHGVVVGSCGGDAFYWVEGNGRRVLGSTAWHNMAMDVNDAGVAVASTSYTYDYGNHISYGALAYDVSTGERVTEPLGITSNVQAINNLNNTAGQNKLRDAPNGSHFQGASWHRDAFGNDTLIGWGDGNYAYDINDRSVAVGKNAKVRTPSGWFTLATSGTSHAYGVNDYWNGGDSRGVICGVAGGQLAWWDGGGALHVVADATISSGAFRRVNDHGAMVGTADVVGVGTRGVLYRNGQMTVLSDVVTSPVTIAKAMDINDRGQILAWTSTGGNAVLLNPVYFADGAFAADSLDADWAASGPGLAEMIALSDDDYCARLTAGSPVTIAQDVSTANAQFDLLYDYQFLTTDPSATLTVMLDGEIIDILSADSILADTFATRSLSIDDEALFGLDDVSLAFTYDGPTGTQVLIDNITIMQTIPEPATLGLVAMGAMIMGRRRRRREAR